MIQNLLYDARLMQARFLFHGYTLVFLNVIQCTSYSTYLRHSLLLYNLRFERIFQRDDVDSEEDKNIDLSNTIPSGTNKMPHILESVLYGLSDR